jgi:hypothetical protein
MTILNASATVISCPIVCKALFGHALTHVSHAMQSERFIRTPFSPLVIAALGQLATHLPHWTQDISRWRISFCLFFDSGFAHQGQFNGPPFIKTVLLIPGPSSTVYRSILNTIPLISSINELPYLHRLKQRPPVTPYTTARRAC